MIPFVVRTGFKLAAVKEYGKRLTSTETDHVTLALARSYLEILSACDLATVFGETLGLSGLFLPSIPKNFAVATHRVLVVGMETKAWRDNECEVKRLEAPTIEAVMKSMAAHSRWLGRSPGRHKFLQFLRQVKNSLHANLPDGDIAVGWGNLFCVSQAGGSPTTAASFSKIQALSTQLLRAHIAAVDPDVIIFTTGASYDRFIRVCFPDRGESVAIESRCLWQFKVDRALCYRTSHPRYVAHNRWRDAALELASHHLRSRHVIPIECGVR